MFDKTCAICGGPFKARTRGTMTCSPKCTSVKISRSRRTWAERTIGDPRWDFWSETDNRYCDVVARLNDEWRVIRTRDEMSWALQHRLPAPTSNSESRRSPRMNPGRPPKAFVPYSDAWRGVSYFTTSEALRRSVRERAGKIDPHAVFALAALPPSIGAPRKAPRREPDAADPLARLHWTLTAKPPAGNRRTGEASGAREQAIQR
ncbi:hypothetical protein [Bradyrhizobium erythrophlei]|uniref:Uncharacterized protein n=1 Tax=Bradyrhizobium erythrophlei TaxID=1437360 RepID=A0A1M7TER5_9BRAD|nr:hypothetical protein [Bradyrhizobium erythrophlei]SHN69143.1 hypothetical protein SAMN05444170_1502 [Bradyrhizobium erythrophlei]